MPSNDRKPIKLILSDIDGTILPYGKTVVSDACLAAFHAALDAGIHIGPASGRGVARVAPVFNGDQACCKTVLATNGMEVYLNGELVRELYLDREGIVALVEAVRSIPGCGLACFNGPEALVVAGAIEDLSASFPTYGPTARYIDEVPHTPIVKANIFTPVDIDVTKATLETLRTQVPAFDYSVPQPGFINMTPKGWNKGEAVKLLCHELGIGLDQAVVFGDGGNDVEMLASVPNSVAVAAAAPEAKAAARWHVGAVEDDAVPAAIMAIARGEWPFTE